MQIWPTLPTGAYWRWAWGRTSTLFIKTSMFVLQTRVATCLRHGAKLKERGVFVIANYTAWEQALLLTCILPVIKKIKAACAHFHRSDNKVIRYACISSFSFSLFEMLLCTCICCTVVVDALLFLPAHINSTLFMYINVCTNEYICVYLYIYIYLSISIYICIYICVYIYIYIYIYMCVKTK